MRIIDTLRTLPNGAPVAPGTEVKVYRDADDALLATVTTGSKGEFTYEVDGNPGVLRYEAIAGASQKIHSTRTVMPVGAIDMSALPVLLSTFLDGVVVGWRDDLAVVADGTSLNVVVGSGVATGRGVIYRQEAPRTIAIPAATSNSRIDLIAVRFWLAETGDNAGRCEVVHRQGTEAATPEPPALVQDATYWETPLAHVTVDPGVLGIALNKVADKRLITVPLIPDGSITKAQLATDIAFGVPYVKNGHTPVVAENVTRLNFDKGLKVAKNTTITETQADITLDFPEANATNGTSSQVARKDHTHNKAVINDAQIVPRDVSSDVNNQTEQTITLPPVKCVCKVRAFLRVASLTGGPTNGLFWVNIAGQTGAKSSYQSDGGVDSLLVAMHTYETSGGTSMKVSWGMTVGAGSVRSTGGWIEWECFPIA